eukprot:gene12435-14692_t
MNVRAAVIHVIGDMVQSIGVCIAGALIWYKPEWRLADPICTFVFALLVLLTTLTVIQEIVDVLMERVPTALDISALAAKMRDLPGVKDIHCMHVWLLSPGKCCLSAHVMVTEFANRDQ